MFFAYLLSNLLVLIAALVAGVTTHYLSVKQIESILLDYTSTIVGKINLALDERAATVRTVAQNVAADTEVLQFAAVGTPLTGADKFEAYLQSQRLASYILASRAIYGAFVYTPENGSMITETGRYEAGEYYTIRVEGETLDEARWKSLISTGAYFAGTAARIETESGRWRDSLIILLSMPYLELSRPAATLGLLLDDAFLDGLFLEDPHLQAGALMVLDRQRRVAFHGGESRYAPFASSLLDGARYREAMIRQVDGERCLVSVWKSSLAGIQYVAVIPVSSFYNQARFFRLLLLVYLLSALGIGVVTSTALARSNSVPIENLFRLFAGSEILIVPAEARSELDFIERAAENAVDRMRVSEQVIESYRPMLRSSLLLQVMISGGIGRRPSRLGDLELAFTGAHFCTVLVSHECGNGDERADELSTIRIADWIESTHPLGADATVLLGVGEATVGVILNNDASVADDVAGRWAEATREGLLKDVGAEVSVGVGGWYEGLPGIHESYREAEKALRYRSFKTTSGVFSYADLSSLRKRYTLPIDLEGRLVACVRDGDADGALKALGHIYDANFSRDSGSLPLAEALFFELMNTSIRALGELQLDTVEVFGPGYDPYVALATCESAQEMRRQLEVILTAACDYQVKRHKRALAEERRRIEAYIRRHYAEPSLDLATIAEHFGYSGNYFSSRFKLVLGKNFKDYLTNTRVRAACNLLESTALGVREVARRVGYGNDVALYRNFRQVTGMTPSEYRTNISSDSKEM